MLSFPSGTSWRAWRANTIHAIASAARRHDDKALEWIVEAVGLETPGNGWISPDRKPAAALTEISHGELGRELALASSAALSIGHVAVGRVRCSCVFQYYSSGKNAELMHGINRIQKITLEGGKH